MILSNDCWLKDTCKKYKSAQAECRQGNIYCVKLFKLDILYNLSLLTPAQRVRMDLFLDADRKDEYTFQQLKLIQDDIEQFVLQGNNLYLYSNITGNGKTAWAIRLMQTYFNSIWYKSDLVCKGLFINVPRYLLALKSAISDQNEYAQHIKENVLNTDIVIWDDIGTKSATSFEHENLLSIIDTRLNDKKCNIFTSNIFPQDLSNLVGDRLSSRVINFSKCYLFQGMDKRGISV